MENIIPQPVLVTGATGFIGQRIVKKLLEDNISVRALVIPRESTPPDWKNSVDIVHGSITDRDSVKKAADGAGTIIHLAAFVGDWGDEKIFRSVTVDGSRILFEEAVKNDSVMVLVSSIVVYGNNIRKGSCGENAQYGRTLGPYSRTKQAQEKLAWEYYRDKKMKLTVVRPANVYGPGSGPWLHDIVDVLRSGMPALVGNRNNNAGLAYVDNVADLLILAGSSPAAIGRAYNACDGLSVTWYDYVSAIARIIGEKKPSAIPYSLAVFIAPFCESIWKALHIKKRPPLTREALNLVGSNNLFPASRAIEELGFQVKVSYARGIAETEKYINESLQKMKH